MGPARETARALPGYGSDPGHNGRGRDLAIVSLRVLRQYEIYRRHLRGELGDSYNGYFYVPSRQLAIIVGTGEGWEHVSASHPDRCPTWEEMDEIKRLFWAPEDCVMQLHVPVTEHISCHPYCLHLWRPIDSKIPQPPAWMVA